VSDPHRLERFRIAQDEDATYRRAVSELRAGRKRSHWMWFVFPQIAGLGQSAMSQTYAIASLAEAIAYLEHPVLGPRLRECAEVLVELQARTAQDVFGAVDAVKLRSSMTLFAAAAAAAAAAPGAATDDEAPFRQVLADYFDGTTDPATESRLNS
jgi:uncharacterized protein (DUF1810 family)